MRRGTVLALFVVVLLLAGLAWWQTGRERELRSGADVPLFDGVVASRVEAIRVENTALDLHVRLERDELGRWSLTDPLAMPANEELVREIVTSALERRGTPVPGSERDEGELGFAPPRILLELQERVDGRPRVSRLEFGALDPDGTRVNVRAHGALLRTWRDLDTTLSRPLEDYKSHLALDVRYQDVVELHRTGTFVHEDPEPTGDASTPAVAVPRSPEVKPAEDLALDMYSENGRWRATRPVQAALDPVAVSLFVQGIGRLEILEHLDSSYRTPAEYGLDPPEIRIEIALASGETRALRLGRPGHAAGRGWIATVEGQPFVWAIEERPVRLLATRVGDLYDTRVFRAARESIQRVVLRCADVETVLSRRGSEWNVWTPADATLPAGGVPAERAFVEDFLGRLERAEVREFPAGESRGADPTGDSITVESEGWKEGGTFDVRSEGWDNPPGTVRFTRHGDGIDGWIDLRVAELPCTPFDRFASRDLWTLNEVEQSALSIRGLGAERRFVRDSKGLWRREASDEEARELREVLDPLLFLRASRFVLPGSPAALDAPIEVRFRDERGTERAFTLGMATPSGEVVCAVIDVDGRRAVPREERLYSMLAKLLRDD